MANYSRQSETFRSTGAGSAGSPFVPVVAVGEHQRSYLGVQSLTLSASAQSLTVPSGATHAEIYCEGASTSDYCRFWPDGTNPTSSAGMKLKDDYTYPCASPSTFRAINSSGSCTLRVGYYQYV